MILPARVFEVRNMRSGENEGIMTNGRIPTTPMIAICRRHAIVLGQSKLTPLLCMNFSKAIQISNFLWANFQLLMLICKLWSQKNKGKRWKDRPFKWYQTGKSFKPKLSVNYGTVAGSCQLTPVSFVMQLFFIIN